MDSSREAMISIKKSNLAKASPRREHFTLNMPVIISSSSTLSLSLSLSSKILKREGDITLATLCYPLREGAVEEEGIFPGEEEDAI
jgi:hypothetical protein